MDGDGRVVFNVGGKRVETLVSTVQRAGRRSFLYTYVSRWNWEPNGEIFIDRDPKYFEVFLNLLRTGELRLPGTLDEKSLFSEAQYYGLLSLVNQAIFDSIDGNRLSFQANYYIPGRLPLEERQIKAIRPGHDGQCSVIHGKDLHIFNPMMVHYGALSLDNQTITNAMWLNSESILIAAEDTVYRDVDVGGLASFSAKSGEMQHRFYVSHNGNPESFSGGALCSSVDGELLFGCCKDRSSVNGGIAVWSRETGNLVQFLRDRNGWEFGTGNRLECIKNGECLLVSKLPHSGNSAPFIGLLDTRADSLVMSRRLPGIVDVIATDGNEVCCLSEVSQKLGFIDLRSIHAPVNWRAPQYKNRSDSSFKAFGWHPRLAFNGTQVFCRVDDHVAVYSRRANWDISSWWGTGSISEIALVCLHFIIRRMNSTFMQR